jgi:hypothetical protein
MNPDTTATPRWVVYKSEDGHHYLWDDRKYDNYDLRTLCRILNEYEEKTNEVARLREELDRLKRGCQGSCYACEPVGEMNLKLEAEVARLGNLLENMTQSRDTMIEDRNLLDNEVARLRELLNRAIKTAERLELNNLSCSELIDLNNEIASIKSTYARLATAPEETQDGATMDEWYGGFSKIESMETSEKDTSTGTCPSEKDTEWRELGPDEVIQEGDEWWHDELGWRPAKSTIGAKVSVAHYKVRTRRPLPNSPESEGIKKQEEMPLENELNYLTREASRAADIHNHVLIVDCIRYLRDEIQKLQVTVNKTTPNF